MWFIWAVIVYIICFSAETLHGAILNAGKHFRNIIFADGTTVLFTAGSLKTSCILDLTYFPFDDQACYVQTDSWTYTADKVSISYYSHSEQ